MQATGMLELTSEHGTALGHQFAQESPGIISRERRSSGNWKRFEAVFCEGAMKTSRGMVLKVRRVAASLKKAAVWNGTGLAVDARGDD